MDSGSATTAEHVSTLMFRINTVAIVYLALLGVNASTVSYLHIFLDPINLFSVIFMKILFFSLSRVGPVCVRARLYSGLVPL